MTTNERAVIQHLADALQVAAAVSTRLRQGLGEASDNAVRLEAAIDRAVRAMKQLQPKKGRT